MVNIKSYSPTSNSFLHNKIIVEFIGTIPPTPACKRALSQVISALKKQGHEVVDLYVTFFFLKKVNTHLISSSQPPNIWEGLKIAYQLLFSDGGA